MAKSTDPFQVNVVSDIPASWNQDHNAHGVFGWLRPMNEFARHAFHLVVEAMIQEPNSQLHARKFTHVDGKDNVRSASVSGSDDQGDQEETSRAQFSGAFKFSTTVYPKDPVKGWYIGTGRGKPEVDVLLGPPDSKWNSNQILGNHARIYIHKESCQATVEALHSMQISGSTGLKHVDQRTGDSSKVLEHGHRVDLGRCAYIYERGDAITNGEFEASLPKFMKLHHGDQWMAHPILSAPSTGSYLTLGGYTFLPRAFAAGTFGEVTAGWAENGSAVAIKRFKRPNSQKFTQHQKIMGLIGKHANILELLHSSSDLEPAFPAIYCVYSPLALANLEDVVKTYKMSLCAQIVLLVDYLQGLTYLHDVKGIMHRDIKPLNLGILSFNPPRGVILDLDAATTEETSNDHMQGTISYLAPEIITLKMPSKSRPPNYGRPIDIWGLGISAVFALTGQVVKWNSYDDRFTVGRKLPDTVNTNFVLEGRLKNFHDHFEAKLATFDLYSRYFNLLKSMTLWRDVGRRSASLAHETAKILATLATEQEEPTIVPRGTQGTKRKLGGS